MKDSNLTTPSQNLDLIDLFSSPKASALNAETPTEPDVIEDESSESRNSSTPSTKVQEPTNETEALEKDWPVSIPAKRRSTRQSLIKPDTPKTQPFVEKVKVSKKIIKK